MVTWPQQQKEIAKMLDDDKFVRTLASKGKCIFTKTHDENHIIGIDITDKDHIEVYWVVGAGERDFEDNDEETLSSYHRKIREVLFYGVTPEQPPETPQPKPVPPMSTVESTNDLPKSTDSIQNSLTEASTPPAPDPIPTTYPVERYRPSVPQASIFEPQGRMIQGLIPQLKEIGKIKIGRKGETRQGKSGNEYRLPEKFDHFEIVSLERDDHGDLKPDKAVMDLIGNNAKELDVMLLYNDPTLNFMTRYNEYKGGKCQCQGDGQRAVDINGTEKECNPDECSQFQAKKCKPNGILSVILMKSPRLGGVYKFRTTSYNSIRSLLSSMFFLQTVTGGQLAGIPLKLTISPMTVQPKDSKTAQTIYVVNLEFHGTMIVLQNTTLQITQQRRSMISKIAELEKVARIALDTPESEEEIKDIEAEFYPAGVES